MIHTSSGKQRSAFSWWMRTGKVPPALNPDGLELKFNPWHDPADGRFTFANSGGRLATAGAASAHNAVGRTSVDVRRRIDQPGRVEMSAAPSARANIRRAELRAKVGQRSIERGSLKTRAGGMPAPRLDKQLNPAAEFIGGVGEGLYGVGKDAVVGTAAMMTTNPLTTVRHAGHAIAGMIDTAIAAEDTPAHVQVARAANAVANASARDLGRATGTVVGNGALTVAPGAALSKVATLRRLRMAAPRPTFDPPQIGWVKETINIDKPWKYYNDGATGSRPGQAPTLMRTMPDGSKRPVKFDGIDGDYVIDRKWSIRDAARARAQILRQSDALMQNHAIGVWEVPNAFQKAKALKLLGKLNVKNIKVRVVEP